MPKAIDPDKRAAIEQAIRDGAGQRSAGSIARDHGVARSTVTKIAAEAGIDGAFERTKVARASRAKQIDNRSRRAALVEAYLGDAERIRLRLWEPAEQTTATGEVVLLTLPSGRDVRDFAMAGTSLVKATIDIEKHDVTDGSGDAKSMLSELAAGLGVAYEAIRRQDAAGPRAD
jgi:hypothetical protein